MKIRILLLVLKLLYYVKIYYIFYIIFIILILLFKNYYLNFTFTFSQKMKWNPSLDKMLVLFFFFFGLKYFTSVFYFNILHIIPSYLKSDKLPSKLLKYQYYTFFFLTLLI